MHKKAGGYFYDFMIVLGLFIALSVTCFAIFGIFYGTLIILFAIGLNAIVWIILLSIQFIFLLFNEDISFFKRFDKR